MRLAVAALALLLADAMVVVVNAFALGEDQSTELAVLALSQVLR